MAFHARPAFVILALPLAIGWIAATFLTSCSNDGDGGLEPNPVFIRNGLPILPLPTPKLTPEFATTDSLARYAKGTVVGQLNRVRLSAKTAERVSSLLNLSGWVRSSAGCRTRSDGAASDSTCSFVIYSCGTATGFDWYEVADGPCIPDEAPFHDWVRFAGSSSVDGSSGAMESFVKHSNRVEAAWTWSMTPDRASQNWSFYNGSTIDENLEGRLDWDESDPELVIAEYLWDPHHKWQAEIAPDGSAGVMTILRREPSSETWIRQEQVRWEPAHGDWIRHDAEGNVLQEHSW